MLKLVDSINTLQRILKEVFEEVHPLSTLTVGLTREAERIYRNYLFACKHHSRRKRQAMQSNSIRDLDITILGMPIVFDEPELKLIEMLDGQKRGEIMKDGYKSLVPKEAEALKMYGFQRIREDFTRDENGPWDYFTVFAKSPKEAREYFEKEYGEGGEIFAWSWDCKESKVIKIT